MSDRIKCQTCDGRGEIELTGVYADTLRGLRRLTKANGYATAAGSAGWFECSPTALNNRFAWLERNGLAVSEKYGKERRFRAT